MIQISSYCIYFILFLSYFSCSIGKLSWLSPSVSISNKINDERRSHNLQKLILIRAGSTIMQEKPPTKNIDVIVSTSLGSKYLDKKKKFTVANTTTIAEIKEMIGTKFSGTPPKGLQRLFYGDRLLSDHEVLGNVTETSIVPLLLDMISGGVSSYSNPASASLLSINQLLDAYLATSVQLAYIGDKLRTLGREEDETAATTEMTASVSAGSIIETITYRDLFDLLNSSIHERYAQDIQFARDLETNPDVFAADTQAWRRRQTQQQHTAIVQTLAKEFDINKSTLQRYGWYTLLILFFAMFGTVDPTGMLMMLPLLWLSKLRQVRLLSKIFRYTVLPTTYAKKIDFFKPLLSAPWQVIGQMMSTQWQLTGQGQDGQGEEEEEEKERAKYRQEVVEENPEYTGTSHEDDEALLKADEEEEEDDDVEL